MLYDSHTNWTTMALTLGTPKPAICLSCLASSFVVIEHNIDFVMDVCHRIMVMVEGKVMAIGTPAEIRGNKQVLDAYLGN